MLRSKPPAASKTGVSPPEDNRWDEIWRLVLSAEQRAESERREFVRAAASDAFVAGQALAILEGSASLLTRAGSLPPETPAGRFIPPAGLKLGRYRIGTLLGEGATGSVYSAWDEELNRPVAIKFFAVRKNGKGAATERPLREARAASALNHPNIIMIHEVIEAPETAAIVMELVEGMTLRELASSGGQPALENVLHWCRQLASALAVAHRNNLIHGDLKPENAMVREDGYVKLLDFGLAIGSSTGERGAAAPLTGTMRYLSPEQYLGEPASQASDVFALGVILYELAAGKYPYEASNAFGLMQEIAEGEVARPRSLKPELPPALDDLIVAMMAKQPGARPAASHAAAVLAALSRELHEPGRRQEPRRREWWVSAAAAMGAVAVIAALWLLQVQGRRHRPLDVSRLAVRPLASQAGLETDPSISPDGLWVALNYYPKASSPAELQIHSTQGLPPATIDTAGLAPQGPAAWSPAANELVFAGKDAQQDIHLFVLSRNAGGGQWSAPRRLAGCTKRNLSACGVDWAPDGKHLAVSDLVPGKSLAELYLIDLSGKRVKTLVPPGPEDLNRPRYSPDGRTIAFSRQASFVTDELCLVSAAGGPVRRLTPTPWFIRGFTWSQSGGGIIAISARQSDQVQLWEFPIREKSEPFRLTGFDVGRGSGPSMARKTGTLTWVRDMAASSIWRTPLTSAGKGGGDAAVRLAESSSRDTDADWSSDGRIVFRSDRSGVNELWIVRADGSNPQQATRFRGPQVGDPHWSPDGRTIAFTGHTDGNADIFAMRCDPACSTPRQLTRTPSSDSNPTWSRDGQWIYFASYRTGRFEVWKLAADGSGAPVRVTGNGGYLSRESADGKWLYFSKVNGREGFYRIALPATGENPSEELVASDLPYRSLGTWTLAGNELLYYPAFAGVAFPPVRALNLQTGATRDLPVNALLARGLSASADGRWLLETREDRRMLLVMIGEEAAQ